MKVDEIYEKLYSEEQEKTAEAKVDDQEVNSLIQELRKTAADMREKDPIKGNQSTSSSSNAKQMLKERAEKASKGDPEHQDLFEELKEMLEKEAAVETISDQIVDDLLGRGQE